MSTVLIVGSGAREHALAWKLQQSPDVTAIFVAPGNAGTSRDAENVPIAAKDVPGLVAFARERDVYLTIIGPEEPLALGLADALRAENRLVVGPGAAAARIESSKSFAKHVMLQSGVPTADFRSFTDPNTAYSYLEHASYPLVIKADGLAAGKGVTVCADEGHGCQVVRDLLVERVHGTAGQRILIEEMLSGPELSLLAFVDGSAVVPLPLAQDHKRLGDGDTGPNTGGMGAYAPVPFVSEAERDALTTLVMQPIIDYLSRDGIPYRGILFAGLMLTADGPRVLEFNCRFGDPEAQAILPLLADDLFPWLEVIAAGRLEGSPRILPGLSSVGVVLASPRYPDSAVTGVPIEGLNDLAAGTLAFHSGTSLDDDGHIVTAGGRVLTIVGTGGTVEEAARRAYSAPVRFKGMQRRTDIGCQAMAPRSPGRAPFTLGLSVACGPTAGADNDVAAGRGELANRRGGPDRRRQGSRRLAPFPVRGTVADERQPVGTDRPATGDCGDTSRVVAASQDRTTECVKAAGIAVLASGSGTNLQAILDAQASGQLAVDTSIVISHNPDAEAMNRATDAGIPALALPWMNRHDVGARTRFEQELLALLAPYQPEIIVLAGWMVILSESFLARCGCPVINVHPALLGGAGIPSLRGQHAVRDALALGLPYTGVTIHHVTPEVDAGPIILSEIVRILPNDTEETLYRRIKPVEHRLLPLAIWSVLHSRQAGGVYA